jgi:hypothetical protein
LKPPKKLPSTPWPEPACGLSHIADSAGDSVSELIADSTVEIAIVSANCW